MASICRMLVYEYVNNGNLEQWLHGAMRQHGTLTWEARMKILLDTAKAYVDSSFFFLKKFFSTIDWNLLFKKLTVSVHLVISIPIRMHLIE